MKQKKTVEKRPTSQETKAEEPKVTNRPFFRYDPEQKSWVGPKKNDSKPTIITQRINDREKQLQQQDHTTLKVNKKKLQRVSTPDLNDDGETGETLEGHAQPVGNQPSYIEQPFAKEHTEVPWTSAIVSLDKNPRLVQFERPIAERPDHFMSTNQEIQRLEKTLEKKEQETVLLKEQLFKSHRENHKLVQQLNMFSGKDYQDVVKENEDMKLMIARLHRQIQLLKGEKRREENTTLQQIKREQELEELHMKDWHHPKPTAKEEQYALNTSLQ